MGSVRYVKEQYLPNRWQYFIKNPSDTASVIFRASSQINQGCLRDLSPPTLSKLDFGTGRRTVRIEVSHIIRDSPAPQNYAPCSNHWNMVRNGCRGDLSPSHSSQTISSKRNLTATFGACPLSSEASSVPKHNQAKPHSIPHHNQARRNGSAMKSHTAWGQVCDTRQTLLDYAAERFPFGPSAPSSYHQIMVQIGPNRNLMRDGGRLRLAEADRGDAAGTDWAGH